MFSLFLGLVILAAATGLARRLFKFCRFEFIDDVEALVFSSALGLGLFAYLVFFLGSLGWLKAPVFVTVIGVLFIFFWRETVHTARGAFLVPIKTAPRWLWIPVILAAFFSLCGALAPAIGQDELCYHLVQPAQYVRTGEVYEVPFSTNSLWPYLMEMLFTLGILLHDATLGKLFHFVTYLLTGGALYAFLRRSGGPAQAAWGAALYLLTPATFIQAAFAYVDNALALYVFLAAYALCVYANERKMSWAALAGVMAGFAASTKLLGLFVLPVAWAFFALRMAQSGRLRPYLPGLALFTAACAASGSVWYIRSAWLRGNPIFPFYPQFFAGHGWQDPSYVQVHGREGWPSFFILPWDLTLHPEWFGGEHIGPFYLLLFPLLWMAGKVPLFARQGLFFALLYTALWYVIDPNVRFLFPSLALLCAALAWPLERFGARSGIFGVFFRGVFASLFFLEAVFAVYHFRDEASLLLRPDKRGYLLLHERSYAVAEAVNARLSPSDKILSAGESRGYYFRNLFTLEGDFHNMTHYDTRFTDAERVVSFLKELEYTHVLASDSEALQDPRALRVSSMLRDPALRERHFREDLVVENSGVRYVLYRIL